MFEDLSHHIDKLHSFVSISTNISKAHDHHKVVKLQIRSPKSILHSLLKLSLQLNINKLTLQNHIILMVEAKWDSNKNSYLKGARGETETAYNVCLFRQKNSHWKDLYITNTHAYVYWRIDQNKHFYYLLFSCVNTVKLYIPHY